MFAIGMREVRSWLSAILSTGTVLGMPASTMRSGGLKLGNIMCWILCMFNLASVMWFMNSKVFFDDELTAVHILLALVRLDMSALQ